MENKYNQGDVITFDLNEKLVDQQGIVCGVVGPVIIVELKTKLDKYPFTHIYVLDAQVKK